MNKTLTYSLAAVGLVLIAGCASFRLGGPAKGLPPFRINMRLGFKAHSPANPPLQGSDKEWVDVRNWQKFLETQKGKDGFPVLAQPYNVNEFGLRTYLATKTFQRLADLPETGCVNLATFQEAVANANPPMPYYPPVRAGNCNAIHKPHGHRHGKTVLGDLFRNHYMALNCADTGSWCDVYDWQVFLADNGYLIGNYPPAAPNTPTFDPNVQKATTRFQSKWGITGDPTGGKVGTFTFNAATGVGTIGQKFVTMHGELLGSSSDISLTPRPTAVACGNQN